MLLLGPMVLGEGGREGAVKEDRIHAQHNGKVWGCRQATHSARCLLGEHFGLPYTTHTCKDVTDRKSMKVNSILPTCPILPAYLVSYCSEET